MKKSLSLFLSLRYLKPRGSFVSVITVLAILGVVLGVWILTVVIAIMTGLGDEMRDSVVTFQPHMEITQDEAIDHWQPLMETVRQLPGVTDARPFTDGQAVLDFGQRVKTIRIRGINEVPGAILEKLQSLTSEGLGRFDVAPGQAVVSTLLADGMHIEVGDKLSLLTLANGRELLDAHNESRKPQNLIPPLEFTVAGLYETRSAAVDPTVVFINLAAGQELYGLQSKVDGIAVDLADPEMAEPMKQAIAAKLDKDVRIVTWIERNKALFDALATERLMTSLLLFMTIVVAGFAITNTMITVTTQKRQEIGLLKAVGAQSGQVAKIFLAQGLVVGLIGSIGGLALAMGFLSVRRQFFQFIAFLMGFDYETRAFLTGLPARIDGVDIALISVGAFIACAVSSLIPAYFASRLDAASALRNVSG